MYLISSCLTGVNCRYNGTSNTLEKLNKLIKEGKAIALCPEILANLKIPRESCEIVLKDGQKHVIGKSKKDYTQAFLSGAQKTLEICQVAGIKKAVLQSRSPSCGYGKIYDGTFGNKLINGNGITAELLESNGITITTEEDWK
uniref:DUF523 domain-containing protein n=1 Tax=uncultured Draconibacterium sp. TaxID=1573823 RepID=UPI003217D2E9